MKSLRDFQSFDAESFLKGKVLAFVSASYIFRYDNGVRTSDIEGIKIQCAIVQDQTVYDDGTTGKNLFEKLNLKILSSDLSPDELNSKIPQGTYVSPKKIVKSSVYGDYSNLLSITTTGISILGQKNEKQT